MLQFFFHHQIRKSSVPAWDAPARPQGAAAAAQGPPCCRGRSRHAGTRTSRGALPAFGPVTPLLQRGRALLHVCIPLPTSLRLSWLQDRRTPVTLTPRQLRRPFLISTTPTYTCCQDHSKLSAPKQGPVWAPHTPPCPDEGAGSLVAWMTLIQGLYQVSGHSPDRSCVSGTCCATSR